MARNILNIDSGLRQINPRSGSSVFVDLSSNQIIHGIKTFDDDIYLNSNLISTGNISTTGTISGTLINNNQFVDLSNNQTISGIKRFLNNLITNSDVNFNTTANVGRIVFKPNEPGGSGNEIVSIYTTNEIDGIGWIFDSVGNLYYIGGGLSPVKIMLSGGTGDITILGNFNGFGNIFCYNILTSDIIGSHSGGDIIFNNGIALGSNIINSGNITSNGTISGVDIISLSSFNTDLIKAITGTIKNLIQMDNRFIDTGTGSVDIKSTYVGFPHLSQTLTTVSKYMYIKPLTTGNFEIKINGISNVVLGTDWSQLATATQLTSSWYNTAGVLMGFINPNPPTGTSPTMRIMGTSNQYIYYNVLNNFGNYNSTTATTNWEISSVGAISCSALNASSGTIQTTGAINGGTITVSTDLKTNKISPNVGDTINVGTFFGINFLQSAGVNRFRFLPTTTSGDIFTIWRTSDSTVNNGNWFYSTTGSYGYYASTVDGIKWEILSNGSAKFSGGILSNTITSYSGTTISSDKIWNFKNASAITNITLDATTTSGIRLLIYGVAGGTRYLYYDTNNNLGVYNASTSTSVWSIDGTTGNIVTIGSYSVASLSATSLLCNSMSPLSGTVINIGATSEFNWLKSAGVSRVRLYPTSTTGDIMQITRVSDAAFGSGYWYFNNSGNLGYNTSGVSVWELLSSGTFNALVVSAVQYQAKNTYTYKNVIDMENLYYNTSVASIDFRAQYIGFAHPSQSLTTASKYGAINPATDGNFGFTINNIAGQVLKTDWSTVVLKTDYNFQCFGKYNYIEGSQTGNICGHWSNRTDTLGNPVTNIGNNWVTMGGMENNNASVIGSGYPNAGFNRRVFTWLIENTNNSGKALGLACNKTNTPNSVINTLSQASGFSMMGYYATNRGGAAYSFTGEHSSMVCDEEYDDLMNYNTDDFIGMVVCSSGKIYNLPYDVDGNTYTKQVDNIKSVDSQPMTRLSKKYKDKSVLGVISHIEKVGKNRNDLNATSWTGCMALDKDERRRIRVASIGEGGIFITNEYGNIENGDYITTSNIAGYATKQDDSIMHNYTIAKATMDCEFDIEKPDEYKTKYLGDGIYASYIACIFYCG